MNVKEPAEAGAAAPPSLDEWLLGDAIVTAVRRIGLEHWPFLKGDGWPAYAENGTTQVLLVSELAAAIAHDYERLLSSQPTPTEGGPQ